MRLNKAILYVVTVESNCQTFQAFDLCEAYGEKEEEEEKEWAQFYCLSLKEVRSDMLDPDPHGATLTSQLVKRGLGLVSRRELRAAR